MNQTKIFNGYWMGYQPNGNTLDLTPSYINRVALFVAGPANDGKSLDINYLTKVYSKADQIKWAGQLQKQGAEVVMSLMDTPSMHWNDVDIPAFVQNFKAEVIDGEWGLNGVDIDLESGMPAKVWSSTFIRLIEEFRKVLGAKGAVNSKGKAIARISVPAYRPQLEKEILEATGKELDWLSTMAYWNDAQQNESMFVTYSKYVEQVNMGIGVAYQGGTSTDLDEVKKMAGYAARTANCGMMEFGLNNDCPYYTQQPQWTWASAINSGMNG